MKILEITIPGRQLAKNRHYRRGKGNRFYLSKEYKAYENFALGWLLHWGNVYFPGRVLVCAEYYPPDRRGTPDMDNLYKSWGDLLQKSGLIDNDRNIKWGDCKIMEPDRDNPRVEIIITEIEGG